MTRKPTRRGRRKRTPKKPLENFLDNLLGMLETLASTALFGAGTVLLSKALGSPKPPLIELPTGLPLEVVAEWERLLGGQGGATVRPRRNKAATVAETVESDVPAPQPKPVQLIKGSDGVYRPA